MTYREFQRIWCKVYRADMGTRVKVIGMPAIKPVAYPELPAYEEPDIRLRDLPGFIGRESKISSIVNNGGWDYINVSFNGIGMCMPCYSLEVVKS
jgi:hypothetical protein